MNRAATLLADIEWVGRTVAACLELLPRQQQRHDQLRAVVTSAVDDVDVCLGLLDSRSSGEQLARAFDALVAHVTVAQTLAAAATATVETALPAPPTVAAKLTSIAEALAGDRESLLSESAHIGEQDAQASPGGAFSVSEGVPTLRSLSFAGSRLWSSTSAREAVRDGIGRTLLQEIARMSVVVMVRHEATAVRTKGLFERRMLSALDALFARAWPTDLGPLADTSEVIRHWPVEEALSHYIHEVTGDAGRIFVRTFVTGCIAGRSAVRALAQVNRGLNPAHRDTVARALILAPHPGIDGMMCAWCAERDITQLRIATRVLRGRRAGNIASLVPLLSHPEVEVRGQSARALIACNERDAAPDLLWAAAEQEMDDWGLAVLSECLLALDDTRGLTLIRQQLSEEMEEPDSLSGRARGVLLRCLAVAGDRGDLEMMSSLCVRTEDIIWLGTFGHVGAVEQLLDMLDETSEVVLSGHGRESRAQAAARALQRMLGRFDAATLGHQLGQGHGHIGERPDAVTRDGWRAWWQEHGERFVADVRYRSGEPYSLAAVCREALADNTAADTLRSNMLEMTIATAGMPMPPVDHWWSLIASSMQAAEELVRHAGAARQPLHMEGEWLAPRLGKRRQARLQLGASDAAASPPL